MEGVKRIFSSCNRKIALNYFPYNSGGMSGDNYYMLIENRRPAEKTSVPAVSCVGRIPSLAHPRFQEVSGNKDFHNTWIKTCGSKESGTFFQK